MGNIFSRQITKKVELNIEMGTIFWNGGSSYYNKDITVTKQ